MKFISTRVITPDIKRLIAFYEQITGKSLTVYTDDFAELSTSLATLAIGSSRTLRLFGPQATPGPDGRTAITEFLVSDVDAEYRRISGAIDGVLIQEPTTMPWGNRSLLFRDPDGNWVNFFTPVTPDALQKFKKHLNP
jgi:catechol 2,3-dioxygenase-like lactoylglutathione lyase family enzyme